MRELQRTQDSLNESLTFVRGQIMALNEVITSGESEVDNENLLPKGALETMEVSKEKDSKKEKAK